MKEYGTKIKICGLTREEEILCVNREKPDYVGFVFWEKSRRAVDAGRAAMLRECLDPEIRAVGVFVNERPEEIIRLLKNGIIDLAQLHGEETEDEIRRIRFETGKQVIRAVRIKSREDIRKWERSKADFLLLDSGMGSGKLFDWSMIPEMEKPFFLAGGLNPSNGAEAARTIRPYALDVSSGVETNGMKDEEKIRMFIRSVRNEQRQIRNSRGTVYFGNPDE